MLTYIREIVGLLRKIVTSLHGYEHDKIEVNKSVVTQNNTTFQR